MQWPDDTLRAYAIGFFQPTWSIDPEYASTNGNLEKGKPLRKFLVFQVGFTLYHVFLLYES